MKTALKLERDETTQPIEMDQLFYSFRADPKQQTLSNKMGCFASNVRLVVRYWVFRIKNGLYPPPLGILLLLLNPVAYELGRIPMLGTKLTIRQTLTCVLLKALTSRYGHASLHRSTFAVVDSAGLEKLSKEFHGSPED